MSKKKKGGVPPAEHRFKPGQSGNPAGRPPKKDGAIFAEVSRELLACGIDSAKEKEFRAAFPGYKGKVTNLVVIVGQTISKARQGSVKHAEFLAERTFGKVPTTVEMEHRGGAIDFDGLAAYLAGATGDKPEG